MSAAALAECIETLRQAGLCLEPASLFVASMLLDTEFCQLVANQPSYKPRTVYQYRERPTSACVRVSLFVRGLSRLHYVQERVHGTVPLLCCVGSQQRGVSTHVIAISKAVCSTVASF